MIIKYVFIYIYMCVKCINYKYVIIFQLFQLVSHENDIERIVGHFLCLIVVFMYTFLSNYAGQEITDHHNRIFFIA
jgi:hypothetical protein